MGWVVFPKSCSGQEDKLRQKPWCPWLKTLSTSCCRIESVRSGRWRQGKSPSWACSVLRNDWLEMSTLYKQEHSTKTLLDLATRSYLLSQLSNWRSGLQGNWRLGHFGTIALFHSDDWRSGYFENHCVILFWPRLFLPTASPDHCHPACIYLISSTDSLPLRWAEFLSCLCLLICHMIEEWTDCQVTNTYIGFIPTDFLIPLFHLFTVSASSLHKLGNFILSPP